MVQNMHNASEQRKNYKFCTNFAHFAGSARHTVDTKFCTKLCACRITDFCGPLGYGTDKPNLQHLRQTQEMQTTERNKTKLMLV